VAKHRRSWVIGGGTDRRGGGERADAGLFVLMDDDPFLPGYVEAGNEHMKIVMVGAFATLKTRLGTKERFGTIRANRSHRSLPRGDGNEGTASL
jgi:hypothetical protein